MAVKTRPYLFYDTAVSICEHCLERVEAKILFQDDQVFMEKWCPAHGRQRVLVADDVAYYRRAREVFLKSPERPLRFNTPMKYGCPYDCGICPDHMQHGCLTLIEICDHCNLSCPICYAGSGPHRPKMHSLDEIAAMLDAAVANEGEPDVVQISGGEPTLHPDFFTILDMARARPIRHLMLNTNGIRIAQEPEFAQRLAEYVPGFEIYLQFDSLQPHVLRDLRGANLVKIRKKALERLNALNLSTNLVVTVKKGVNDSELGSILEYASQQPCVRGVTFQPIQAAGRHENYDPATNRLTLTEVRRRILEQTQLFAPEDIIPVPCNADSLAMAYGLKEQGRFTPLTRLLDPQTLMESSRNTIILEKEQELRNHLVKVFATNHSPISSAASLKELLCCLPKLAMPKTLNYNNVFRVIIMQFSDLHAFDLRVVKKSCVHIAQPDGRLIPFDTFNIFYRDDAPDKWKEVREDLERKRQQYRKKAPF